jgi:fermentation-respiration switch protein FrsA (DUF1100 family)
MSGQTGLSSAAHWLLAGLALWMGLRWFERANLYFPSKEPSGAHPGSYGLKFEEATLPASDGPLIRAWYVENRPDSPVLLFCHGNAGNITHRLDKLLIFRRAGASVLLYDYRGYGASTGSPSEQGTYRDAEAAYRWLVEEKGVAPGRIVLYGESLGAAVAVEISLRHKAAGLILDSAFTSTADMGRLLLPFLPIGPLIRNRYESLAKIPKVPCPVLVMHNPQDDIVHFEMGHRLYADAPEPKTFFEMKGGHNEGFLDTGEPYEEAVRAFLAQTARR